MTAPLLQTYQLLTMTTVLRLETWTALLGLKLSNECLCVGKLAFLHNGNKIGWKFKKSDSQTKR